MNETQTLYTTHTVLLLLSHVFAALGFCLWSLGVERQGYWCCCVQLQLLQDFVLVGRGVQGGRDTGSVTVKEEVRSLSFFSFICFILVLLQLDKELG